MHTEKTQIFKTSGARCELLVPTYIFVCKKFSCALCHFQVPGMVPQENNAPLKNILNSGENFKVVFC